MKHRRVCGFACVRTIRLTTFIGKPKTRSSLPCAPFDYMSMGRTSISMPRISVVSTGIITSNTLGARRNKPAADNSTPKGPNSKLQVSILMPLCGSLSRVILSLLAGGTICTGQLFLRRLHYFSFPVWHATLSHSLRGWMGCVSVSAPVSVGVPIMAAVSTS